MSNTNKDILTDIASFAGSLEPRIVSMADSKAQAGDVLLLPTAMAAKPVTEFLDPLLPKPRFKRGTFTAGDLQSFINFMLRHKQDGKSAVFVEANGSKIVGIINMHGGGADEQAHADFQAHYTPKFSDPWKAWEKAMSGEAMSTGQFAAFIDDHIEDIGNAPVKARDADPATQRHLALEGIHKTTYAGQEELLLLSRGIKVNLKGQVAETVNTQSGELAAVFEIVHEGEKGRALKIPGLFILQIPVYDRGDVYRLPCRLRYRVEGGQTWWSFTIINKDLALQTSVEDMRVKIEKETVTLPTIYGSFAK